MGRNINAVEKAEGESDALRSASGNLAPANLPYKWSENDCVEEDLVVMSGVTCDDACAKCVCEGVDANLAASAALASVHDGVAHSDNCRRQINR